ncbi:MAG: methyltransferase domain-containing protein [Calditrichia bacterium]|nr:methyltransferase domain-containing protein [Calditrichia bacterium]
MTRNENIVKYYETCDGAYKKAWDLNNSLAFHYGFWDKHIKNLPQALEYENEVLVQIAKINKNDNLLDAGCGVGGSSIYLAKNIECKVTGITLSKKQVNEARNNAEKHQVENLAKFEIMDFTKTAFKEKNFDVVWAIESVCYASSKEDFLKEAFRILKPGGRLIIADGFGLKKQYSTKEQKLLDKMNHGWQVDSLENIEDFKSHASKAGFKEIQYQPENKRIWPSVKRLFLFSLLAIPYGKFEVLTGRMSTFQLGNAYTSHYQYRTLRKKLWEYGIFYAIK